jgi:hypothetical protein
LLTASADDSPTNNGEDNDDGGCNSNHLISRHVLTSRFPLASLDEQSAKEKGRARGRPLHNPPKLARHCHWLFKSLTLREAYDVIDV